MSWDAIAALASFGQLVVVLLAATLGFAQLRQLHRQNELQATIPYFAYTRTSEFNAGFLIVRDETLGLTEDHELRAALAVADLSHPRLVAVFNLANFFADRARAVPFFVDWPDESLIHDFITDSI